MHTAELIIVPAAKTSVLTLHIDPPQEEHVTELTIEVVGPRYKMVCKFCEKHIRRTLLYKGTRYTAHTGWQHTFLSDAQTALS